MRSDRQVHVYSNEVSEVTTVRKTTCGRLLSSTGFVVLLIIGISLVVTASIAVPVVLVKRSNEKTVSYSAIKVTTIPTTSFSNSTSITTKITTSTTISPTITSTTISYLLTTDASMTMVSETEESFTDDNNSTFSLMESSVETIMSKTSTTISRTTIMIPPNLLINPGAEEGNVFGWSQTGSSPVIADSNGGLNSGYYPRTGRYCFAGGYGANGSPSRLVQNVKLVGGIQGFTESHLNSRPFRAEVEFYYQTWDTVFMRHDQVEVSLSFRSATSSILYTETTRELACKTSNPGWCRYFNVFQLPIGTRSIDYTMTFVRRDVGGTHIDSYIDDNSLRII